MFVTSLLGDWWRTLDHNRTVGNNNPTNRQDTSTSTSTSTHSSNTHEDFLEHQKKTWTPSELYEKCCPRFLAGGVSEQTKNGQFVCACSSCRRRCDKIHPIITLYFDANKKCTIATPSHRLDPFLRYLDRRVREKSAVAKSPYYYELDGFVRDNLHQLRHQQRLFGNHLVKVALGALKESDAAQAALLEESHLRRHLRRHGHGHGHRHRDCHRSFPPSDRCFDDSAEFAQSCSSSPLMEIETKSPSSSSSSSSYYQDVERLETVLDICRLWGIGDHLDVLSIDCMLQTSRVFRKVAIPMAEQRVRDCQFVVTPLVDGHYATGYSVFRRANADNDNANDDRQKVFQREHDRLVEYAVCPSTVLLHCREENDNQEPSSDNKNNTADRKTNTMSGRYLPEFRSNISSNGNRNTNDAEAKGSAGFSWACEELSFANLEPECMNIGLHEYMGQKLIVQWRRCEVDIADPRHASVRDDHYRDRISTNVVRYESSPCSADRSVFRLVLGWAPQKVGIVDLSVPHFGLKLDVSKNCVAQVDDVTFSYKGNAQILECRADFCFLVAAYARSLQPYLVTEHRQIETRRPLLRHEKEFLGHVQNATSLCPVSSRYL